MVHIDLITPILSIGGQTVIQAYMGTIPQSVINASIISAMVK